MNKFLKNCYKNFTTIFWLIFSIGVITILFIEPIYSIFGYHGLDLKAAEKLNLCILWLSATILLWYTKETYELKMISLKNNYGLLSINKVDINFAGLEIPNQESKDKFMNIEVYLKNTGKGLLKLNKLHADCVTATFINSDTGKYIVVGGGAAKPKLSTIFNGFNSKLIFAEDTKVCDFLLEVDKSYYGEMGFRFKAIYQDINGEYEHTFFIKDINLRMHNFTAIDDGKVMQSQNKLDYKDFF